MNRFHEAAIRPAPSGGAVLRVKAVPGASRSEIVGPLGDRVKIALAVPAEKGGANRALELLLAETLGLPRKAITIASGGSSPEKEVLVSGIDPVALRARLEAASTGPAAPEKKAKVKKK
jgi:uncharacterized protein YggU (UPF0235/DUF167 family)